MNRVLPFVAVLAFAVPQGVAAADLEILWSVPTDGGIPDSGISDAVVFADGRVVLSGWRNEGPTWSDQIATASPEAPPAEWVDVPAEAWSLPVLAAEGDTMVLAGKFEPLEPPPPGARNPADLYLVRLDGASVTWESRVDLDLASGFVDDVRILSHDRGVIVSASVLKPEPRSWLLYLDGAGSLVWQQEFGHADGSAVAAMSDGSFIAVGTEYVFPVMRTRGDTVAWLFDGAGGTIARTVVHPRDAIFGECDRCGEYSAVASDADAAYVVSDWDGQGPLLVTRLDKNGAIVWQTPVAGTPYEGMVIGRRNACTPAIGQTGAAVVVGCWDGRVDTYLVAAFDKATGTPTVTSVEPPLCQNEVHSYWTLSEGEGDEVYVLSRPVIGYPSCVWFGRIRVGVSVPE